MMGFNSDMVASVELCDRLSMDASIEFSENIEEPNGHRVIKMPAYREFKNIIDEKWRTVSCCVGLDVLHPDFRPNFMTAITVIATMSITLIITSTAVFSDGELALTANACVRVAYKVTHSN